MPLHDPGAGRREPAHRTDVKPDGELPDLPLDTVLASAIEMARMLRDDAEPQDKRELALVVTKLEEAGLWLCESRARQHLGENALLDWLRGI